MNALEIVPGENLVFSTVDENQRLDVIATRSDGSPYDGTPSWSSNNGTVVDVTPQGIVTALAAGSATVTASIGNVFDSVLVTVSTPIPASATVSEPGYEGQAFDIGTAFGSTTIDSTSQTATVLVSAVEDTLVVATAPDGRVFLSIARTTPTTGLNLQQATTRIGVSALDTAWTLIYDHPLLMVRSEDSNSITDTARENLACLLDSLKNTSCTRVTTAADTQQAFDDLVTGLRSTGHDFQSDAVQDALLQAALRVSRDLDASLGLSTASLASYVLTTRGTDDYDELPSVDIDRFHYDLGINGNRVLPRLLSGDVFDRTSGGGRGVDYTFRFIQVDASQYTSRDDIANSIRSRTPLAVTGWSQTRLLPLNSITKRMSIFNWISEGVTSLFSWLPWVDNEPPGSVELQDDHAYVVVGTSPGWGINVRSEVRLDVDRIPLRLSEPANLPGVYGDIVANRVHNGVALALDAVLIHGSFTRRFSDNLRARVAEDAAACMINATTGYIAGDWSTDANRATSFFTDLATCTTSALITNEISDFSDASTAEIEGWKRHVGNLITQAGRMVTTAMQEASRSGSLQPQFEPISTTVALAALVAKYELALKIAGVGHRVADMFLTLTPIEVAVVQLGQPEYARQRDGSSFDPVPSYFTFENVTLGGASGGTREVGFDISWDESWRGPDGPTWVAAPDNWDAAWVFVKYRVNGGAWQHATLAGSGHVAPSGAVVDVPSDGMGAFIYRSGSGYGTFTANGVGLQWDYVADGVSAGASVEVRPFGIEMVFVQQGSFSVGSGGSSHGEFRAGGTSNTPFVVSSQSSTALGNAAGQLYWTASTYSGSPSGSTNASFPTGYGPFYVMKYQVTQGQYVDFLNSLTQAQADARKYTGSSYRYAITGSSVGSYATSLPFVAMNYASWADGAAFADWAGLRPLTELEFEKVARGPLGPVANEYAWGSTSITQATGLANAGTITETPAPSGANANYWVSANPVQGPVRVGSFAAPGRSRRDAGAGYYGALELSGNVWERPVSVGNAEGRAFTGSHGDGALDAGGNANVASWPGSTAVGAGMRGSSWAAHGGDFLARVSSRNHAANTDSSRADRGWRGARSAP